MKKFWKILIIVLLVLLVLAGGYVAYVFLDYHRIPDNQTLDVYEQEPQPIAQTGQDYRVLTWNIGFGAYEDDYGFFMDGGTESWAWSEDRLKANLAEISNVLLNEAADIYFLQEVDFDSTRTYHVDERPYLYQAQPDFCKLHAVNYDSPFLLYPLTQPHGRKPLLSADDGWAACDERRPAEPARGDGVHEAARPRPVLLRGTRAGGKRA